MRICLLTFLILPAIALAQERDLEALALEATAKFEQASREMPFLGISDFLYGRELLVNMPGDGQELYRKRFRELTLTRHPPKVLIPLLEHEDPKVRTLALMGLFAHEDPLLLPHIFGLAHDWAGTFPEPEECVSYATTWPRYVEPTLKPLTVSSVARRMIGFYAERSRASVNFDPKYCEQSFSEYFEPRAKRGTCAGWCAVRLDRLTGGMNPIREPRKFQIQDLLRELEKSLPPVDQELTILLLFSARDLAEVIDPQRLVLAARRLGPDRLMDVLDGNPPTEDPDLGPGTHPGWAYIQMCAFILRHATGLLRASDADRLLANPWRTFQPLYPIAAAELVPERAKAILFEAFKAYSGEHDQEERGRIVTALARMLGDEEQEFLVDWLYTEPDQPSHGPPHRSLLLTLLLDRFLEPDRRNLAAIIKDPRFLRLDGRMLEILCRGLDENLLTRLFTEEEFLRTTHSFGFRSTMLDIEKARRDHPEETANILKLLAGWRRRIRGSLREWAPAGK